MKIKHKLIAIFMTITIIAVLLGTFAFMHNAKTAIVGKVSDQLESTSILKENQIKQLIRESEEDIQFIASDDAFTHALLEHKNHTDHTEKFDAHHEGHSEIRALLLKKFNNEEYEEAFVIDPNGVIHISTDTAQEGKIVEQEDYFIQGKKGKYIGGYAFDPLVRKYSMIISMPLKHEDFLIGVLALRIDLKQISDIMIERIGLGNTGETYLVSPLNYMLTQSRFFEGYEYKKKVYTEQIDACLKGKSGFGIQTDYRGERVYSNYEFIDVLDACLFSEIDVAEADEPIDTLLIKTIIVSIILTGIIVTMILFFSEGMVKPFLNIQKAMQEIQQGNLDVRLNINTKDEFQEVSEDFNKTAKRLKKNKEALDKANKELEKKVRQRTKELDQRVRELERFNKLTIGRELKMIELKKKLQDKTK